MYYDDKGMIKEVLSILGSTLNDLKVCLIQFFNIFQDKK